MFSISEEDFCIIYMTLIIYPNLNFACLVISSTDFFSKLPFLKNDLRKTFKVSNSFDPYQARCFVGPELGPNCFK